MFTVAAPSSAGWVTNSVLGAHVIRRQSADGIKWSDPEIIYTNRPELDYSNNIGVASDNQGWLIPNFSLIAFGSKPHGILASTCRNQPYCLDQLNIDGFLENFSHAPVYRLSHPTNGHLFTINRGERDALVAQKSGWVDEGAAGFQVDLLADKGQAPILRYYSNGQHYLTLNQAEGDSLVALGWTFDGAHGTVFPGAVAGAVEINMLYNPNNGEHFYTLDTNEVSSLQQSGWVKQTSLGWSPQ